MTARLFPAALALLSAMILSAASASAAATQYVAERIEAPLRAGPGDDYRASAYLAAGTPVEVLQVSGGWTRVRSEKGQEGWLDSRLVSMTPPRDPQFDIKKELTRLTEENQQLAAKLADAEQGIAQGETTSRELETVQREYERWKIDQANVVELRKRHDDLAVRLRTAEEEAETTRLENRRLHARNFVYWFFSGAVVVLVGYVLGYLYATGRTRKNTGYRF
jgi:SH3 domain protein